VTLPAGPQRSFGSRGISARPSPWPVTFFHSAACCKLSPVAHTREIHHYPLPQVTIQHMMPLPLRRYILACGRLPFGCSRPDCRRSIIGCTCHAISNKLMALSEGKPEGAWTPLTDPSLKFAQAYSPALQDLMTRLLDPNPDTRITAADALRHPWVRGEVSGPALAFPPGELGERPRSFSVEEFGPPVRLKAARTHVRVLEREVLGGTSSRSSGAATCAAAVAKINAMTKGAGGEGDVDRLADPEHQLVDFILSDDAETCRMALIALTTQLAALDEACNFIHKLHVMQNLQQVFITFYKKVKGQMPKLLELLEVLADHRDPRILEALLEHKELIDFVILNAHSSRGARTFLKAQRIIVRCMQAADPSSDHITVSLVMRAFR
jgi:hypothetical protein